MGGYEAFLNGLKPAYIAVDRYEQEQCDELKRKGFPWVRCSDDVSTMFFVNEGIKNKFLSEIEGVAPNLKVQLLPLMLKQVEAVFFYGQTLIRPYHFLSEIKNRLQAPVI